MHYLLILAVSLGIIVIGLAIKEEVFRLSVALAGIFLLIWGFYLTPIHHQLIIEVCLLFPACLVGFCWLKI